MSVQYPPLYFLAHASYFSTSVCNVRRQRNVLCYVFGASVFIVCWFYPQALGHPNLKSVF